MFTLLLLTFAWAITSAEFICNPRVPPPLLPSVASCDYAIRRLEHTDQQRGSGDIIFSPIATEPHGISLPATFLGVGPGYTPVTPVWCIILILWQPRPSAQVPQETFDVFSFSKILQAANSIRDRCLIRRRGHTPQIGREWVAPHQWVDVQFGGIWGPEITMLKANASNNVLRAGHLTVYIADGTNMTISTSSILRDWDSNGTSIA